MFTARTWTRLVTPMLALGTFLTLTSLAEAFDGSSCNQLSASNVTRSDVFNADAGKADFGDDLHLFGAPMGTAVICWFANGRVGVLGKVYADSFTEPAVALAQIRFRRTNGQFVALAPIGIGTNIPVVASRLVRTLSPQGNFNSVRLRLFTSDPLAQTQVNTLVFTRTFNR